MEPTRHARSTRTDASRRPPPWKDITRCWHDMIPEVRRRWPELTYMETLRVAGDRNHLCRLIAERYKVTPDEADDMVWRWQSDGELHVPAEAVEAG